MALSGRGLLGRDRIEWMPMPFAMNPTSSFGFVVLKASGRESPVALMPCILGRYERIVSVADATPSPSGIRLVPIPGNPYAWLGPMSQPVIDAARTFENECR